MLLKKLLISTTLAFKKQTFLIALLFIVSNSIAQKPVLQTYDSANMQWYQDAKLGIFIHYGIYGVNGTVESWPLYNNEISYTTSMDQAKRFTASKYNPKSWANLFKETGFGLLGNWITLIK